MLQLIGHAGRTPSGTVSLGPIAEASDIEISERLVRMGPTRSTGFSSIVEELERSWRLPIIRAYSGVKELAGDRVLVPVKPLPVDPSGHFVQMAFHPPIGGRG